MPSARRARSAKHSDYQMDPPQRRALRKRARLAEGADMIMVKPGMPYLDVPGG